MEINMEKWNEIAFLLSENLQENLRESDFEQNVIQALRVLDWKAFLGDFQIRPQVQLGSSRWITPDFVVNSSDKKKLFVIEIKNPNLPLKTEFQQQLFSYMRQLRLQFGILIGEVIQIFYDGDLTNYDDPVLLDTIEFKRDIVKGEKFVELFSKESFSFNSLETYTKNSLKKISRRADQKVLKQKILSQDYQSQILNLIKEDFLNDYDAELIDKVIQEISVNISSTQYEAIQPEKIATNTKSENNGTRDKTKYIINGSGRRLPKNRFVLELVRQYLKERPSNFSTLKNVFKDEYQGSTGVINILDFVETKYANKSNKRHFTGNDEILTSQDNIDFVVSTEWGKGNIDNIVDLARKKGFKIEEV